MNLVNISGYLKSYQFIPMTAIALIKLLHFIKFLTSSNQSYPLSFAIERIPELLILKAGHPRLRMDYRQIQIRRMDEIQIQIQFKAKPGQPDEDFICAFSGTE